MLANATAHTCLCFMCIYMFIHFYECFNYDVCFYIFNCCILSNVLVRNDITKMFNQSIIYTKQELYDNIWGEILLTTQWNVIKCIICVMLLISTWHVIFVAHYFSRIIISPWPNMSYNCDVSSPNLVRYLSKSNLYTCLSICLSLCPPGHPDQYAHYGGLA